MSDTASRVLRYALLALAVVLLAGLILLVWLGASGMSLARDLPAFQDATSKANAAVRADDLDAAADALAEARTSAAAAADTLNSAPWTLAQRAPVVGETVRALAVLTAASDQVLEQTEGLDEQLAALSAAAPDERLATAMTVLEDSQPQLEAMAVVAGTAASRVESIDPDRVIAVRSRVREAQESFAGLAAATVEVAGAARVLPDMLGMEEKSRWTVLLSQPAEARGTGGFFGAFARVFVTDGEFKLRRSAANGAVRNDAWDTSSLPDEFNRLWGTDAQYLWGFNLTREYPYAAQIADEALRSEGYRSQYIVSLDPRVAAALLQITGPVSFEGVTLSAANAERYLTRDIYVEFPDAREKDKVTLGLLAALFTALSDADTDLVGLMRALADPIGEGRLLVWSPDEDRQAPLQTMQIGGSLTEAPSTAVTVALNNSAGNKIDSFVKSSVTYTVAGRCDAESVQGEVRVRLAMDRVPKNLPPYIAGRNDVEEFRYGSSSMMVHVYGPQDALWTSFRVNGEPVPVQAGFELGRPVWGTKVEMPRRGDATVTVTFGLPAADAAQPAVLPQPMIQDTKVRVFDERSCA